ncbi:hypothetical protein MNAN1_001492 [Malassezia nana]|uniref:Uncharacterized protein n=1 Tax=Malassezia nana TaxID=180528 RepID=A0AAF0EIX3_9BASI|nr:hypothetical protein MNAN1_001492 [Malassezia nana]
MSREPGPPPARGSLVARRAGRARDDAAAPRNSDSPTRSRLSGTPTSVLPAPRRARPSRRATALNTAAALLACLDEHEAALRMPITDAASAQYFFYHQQHAIHAGASLLELIQREARQPHARQLPQMHSVLVRLGTRAIDAPLSALAAWHQSAVSCPLCEGGTDAVDVHVAADDILERAYTETYTTIGALWESATELRMRRACAKWLAYLAQRYVAALEGGYVTRGAWWPIEREAWCVAATHWYGRTAADEPGHALAYLSLAALHRTSPLDALYFLSKSVQTVHPNADARSALHAWALDVQHDAHDPSAPIPNQIVRLLAEYLAGVHAAPLAAEVVAHWDVYDLLETEWAQLGVCLTGLFLEVGDMHAALEAHGTRSEARVDGPTSAHTWQSFWEAPPTPAAPSVSTLDDIEAAYEVRGVPRPLAHLLGLLGVLVQIAMPWLLDTHDAAAYAHTPAVFVVVALSFLQVLTLRTQAPIDAMSAVLHATLPWDQLVAYARHAPLDVWSLAHASSPDDAYFRGLAWPTWPTAAAAAAPAACETDILAERRAAALCALAQTGALTTPLASARHARIALLVALLHAQLARYDPNSLHK